MHAAGAVGLVADPSHGAPGGLYFRFNGNADTARPPRYGIIMQQSKVFVALVPARFPSQNCMLKVRTGPSPSPNPNDTATSRRAR
jgi:hypothetical protein